MDNQNPQPVLQSTQPASPTPPTYPEATSMPTPAHPKPRFVPRWIAITILIIIVLSVSISLINDFDGQKQEPVKTTIKSPTATPQPTTTWKTYTNSPYGFTFQYPSTFKETKSQDNSVSFSTGKANILESTVYPLENYRLSDNAGGLSFYFDAQKKVWFHDNGKTSELVPQKVDDTIEAYIYKTGDIMCSTEKILIPNAVYTYIIEINNTTCTDENGKPLPGYYPLTPQQILSTFTFTENTNQAALSELGDFPLYPGSTLQEKKQRPCTDENTPFCGATNYTLTTTATASQLYWFYEVEEKNGWEKGGGAGAFDDENNYSINTTWEKGSLRYTVYANATGGKVTRYMIGTPIK